MKLEENHKKKYEKITNIWRLNDILLNDEWVTPEINEKTSSYTKRNENENNGFKPLRCIKSDSNREVYSNTCRLKKEEKFKISNLNLHLKEVEKEQTKLKTNGRDEIIKIQAEINDVETKI